MVATTKTKLKPVPPELLAAMNEGPLTQEQLRQLIEHEAGLLDLTFDEAVHAAKRDTLPRTPVGFDLRMLVRMLVD